MEADDKKVKCVRDTPPVMPRTIPIVKEKKK